MTYLDPADTHTIKKIGYNVGVLMGIALALMGVVAILV